MSKLPIYNILLDNAEGIQIMSLVESPAVESDFITFSKEELKFSINEEENIVFGCALRANYPIYRVSPQIGEYYVVFSKEVIKQLYEKFLIEERVSEVNLEHTYKTDGVHLIQSFIKDIDKGINPKGFEEVEDGSWFCAYKVTNKEVWDQVKEGKFKGFSVEGFFNLQLDEPKDEFESLIDEILDEI